MDGITEDPAHILPDLQAHLTTLSSNPTHALDTDLLRRAECALDFRTPQPTLWQILNTGTALLSTLATPASQEQGPDHSPSQDLTPLTHLLTTTLSLLPFSTLSQTFTHARIDAGLTSASPPIQTLCLAYLSKAAQTPSGAAWFASNSASVQHLVKVWLGTPHTGVSERAVEAVVALLEVDSPGVLTVVTEGTGRLSIADEGGAAGDADDGVDGDGGGARKLEEAAGQGLMWRRVFHDPAVYGLFFAYTTLKQEVSAWEVDLKSREGNKRVTTAQARLLDFLQRVAVLDVVSVTTSSLPEVERAFIPAAGQGDGRQAGGISGLLRYASRYMIDPADFLMAIVRRDYMEKLVAGLKGDDLLTPDLRGKVYQGNPAVGNGDGQGQRVPHRLIEALEEEVDRVVIP